MADLNVKNVNDRQAQYGSLFSINIEWMIHNYAEKVLDVTDKGDTLLVDRIVQSRAYPDDLDLTYMASLLQVSSTVPGRLTENLTVEGKRKQEGDYPPESGTKRISLEVDFKRRIEYFQQKISNFSGVQKKERKQGGSYDSKKDLPIDLPTSHFDEHRIRRDRYVLNDDLYFKAMGEDYIDTKVRLGMFPPILTQPNVKFYGFGISSRAWKQLESRHNSITVVALDPAHITSPLRQISKSNEGERSSKKKCPFALPGDCIPRVLLISFGYIPELAKIAANEELGEKGRVSEYELTVTAYAHALVDSLDVELRSNSRVVDRNGKLSSEAIEEWKSKILKGAEEQTPFLFSPNDVESGVEGAYLLFFRFDENALVDRASMIFHLKVLRKVYGKVTEAVEGEESEGGRLMTTRLAYEKMVFPQGIVYDKNILTTAGNADLFEKEQNTYENRQNLATNISTLTLQNNPAFTKIMSGEATSSKRAQSLQVYRLLKSIDDVFRENPASYVTKLLDSPDHLFIDTLRYVSYPSLWLRAMISGPKYVHKEQLRALVESISPSRANLDIWLRTAIAKQLYHPSVALSHAIDPDSPPLSSVMIDNNLKRGLQAKTYALNQIVNCMQAVIGNIICAKKISSVEVLVNISSTLQSIQLGEVDDETEYPTIFKLSKSEKLMRESIIQELECLNDCLYHRLMNDFAYEVAAESLERAEESGKSSSDSDSETDFGSYPIDVIVPLPPPKIQTSTKEYILNRARKRLLVTCGFETKVKRDLTSVPRPPTPLRKGDPLTTFEVLGDIRPERVRRVLFPQSESDKDKGKSAEKKELKETGGMLEVRERSDLFKKGDELTDFDWDPFSAIPQTLKGGREEESSLKQSVITSRYVDGLEADRRVRLDKIVEAKREKSKTALRLDNHRALKLLASMVTEDNISTQNLEMYISLLEENRDGIAAKSSMAKEIGAASMTKIPQKPKTKAEVERLFMLLNEESPEEDGVVDDYGNIRQAGEYTGRQVRTRCTIQLGEMMDPKGLCRKKKEELDEAQARHYSLSLNSAGAIRTNEVKKIEAKIPGTPTSIHTPPGELFRQNSANFTTPISQSRPLSAQDVSNSVSPVNSNQRTAVLPGLGAVDYLMPRTFGAEKMCESFSEEVKDLDISTIPVVSDSESYSGILSTGGDDDTVESDQWLTAAETLSLYGTRAGLFCFADFGNVEEQIEQLQLTRQAKKRTDDNGVIEGKLYEMCFLLEIYNESLGLRKNAPWTQGMTKLPSDITIFNCPHKTSVSFEDQMLFRDLKRQNEHEITKKISNQRFILHQTSLLLEQVGRKKNEQGEESKKRRKELSKRIYALSKSIFLLGGEDEDTSTNIPDLHKYILPYVQKKQNSGADRKEIDFFSQLCIKYVLYYTILARL